MEYVLVKSGLILIVLCFSMGQVFHEKGAPIFFASGLAQGRLFDEEKANFLHFLALHGVSPLLRCIVREGKK